MSAIERYFLCGGVAACLQEKGIFYVVVWQHVCDRKVFLCGGVAACLR
jgi:hypothetical protein